MLKIIQKIISKIIVGRIRLGAYVLQWQVKKSVPSNTKQIKKKWGKGSHRLHIGPGPGWVKPDDSWLTLDADPKRGDITCNFNNDFIGLPFKDGTLKCIYASHVFEHVSLHVSPLLFRECYRALDEKGCIRIVVPDAKRSIEEYLKGNREFELFKRQAKRAKEAFDIEYTLFENMREDFISISRQPTLLGHHSLAHQNAWDYETIVADLCRAGFKENRIHRSNFRESKHIDFSFEGSYPSEANEYYRSMYIEAIK